MEGARIAPDAKRPRRSQSPRPSQCAAADLVSGFVIPASAVPSRYSVATLIVAIVATRVVAVIVVALALFRLLPLSMTLAVLTLIVVIASIAAVVGAIVAGVPGADDRHIAE